MRPDEPGRTRCVDYPSLHAGHVNDKGSGLDCSDRHHDGIGRTSENEHVRLGRNHFADISAYMVDRPQVRRQAQRRPVGIPCGDLPARGSQTLTHRSADEACSEDPCLVQTARSSTA